MKNRGKMDARDILLQQIFNAARCINDVTVPHKVTLPISKASYISNIYMRTYPKISRLAAWSENCKRYSSLPLGAVVSLL
jgi:hypothetical protein